MGCLQKLKKNLLLLSVMWVLAVAFHGKLGGRESLRLHGEILIVVFLEDLLGHGVSDRK